jgi:hypothetical protein
MKCEIKFTRKSRQQVQAQWLQNLIVNESLYDIKINDIQTQSIKISRTLQKKKGSL